MKIKQFEYKPLAHYSYAIISDGKMALVDPERDPMQYYKLAEENNATITAIFETHPHADFVSSHLQIHKETGATIYASKKTGADYPHTPFDDGDRVTMGNATFTAINTPGHSPDSITIQAKEDENIALFTGDTLFVGDVGRPDLREKAGHLKAKREELAKMMYKTIQNKFTNIPDAALVYPAHGAGSLCGKDMSADASSSTLGNERLGNWAFKNQTEEQFTSHLLSSQPFIPHYFGFNVSINKDGADVLSKSIGNVSIQLNVSEIEDDTLVIDTRDEADFKKNHLPNSINIMATSATSKFETWLGSTVKPEEPFYLVANSIDQISSLLDRTAKIGYEKQIKAVVTLSNKDLKQTPKLDVAEFKNNLDKYTIVDIRNQSETEEGLFFDNAHTIPLHKLRENASNLPSEKPIVVHCAGGYRSAAGSSILENQFPNSTVFDLSDAVTEFKK